MTAPEFKKFFEPLPESGEKIKGLLRTKSAFSFECGIPLGYLRGLAKGKHVFSEANLHKVLPVMRRYGFDC